jgi:hypothetical protein
MRRYICLRADVYGQPSVFRRAAWSTPEDVVVVGGADGGRVLTLSTRPGSSPEGERAATSAITLR